MAEQYVPSEPFARSLYVLGSRNSSPDISADQARAEFDRFLARVHRDAAREALVGFGVEWDGLDILHPLEAAFDYADLNYPRAEGQA